MTSVKINKFTNILVESANLSFVYKGKARTMVLLKSEKDYILAKEFNDKVKKFLRHKIEGDITVFYDRDSS